MRRFILLSLAFIAMPVHAQQDFSATLSETLEEPEQIPDTSPPVQRGPARVAQVWYAGCDEVRLSGRAPLYRGQPGYRSEMDSDNDGVACEWRLGAYEEALERQMERMRRKSMRRVNR